MSNHRQNNFLFIVAAFVGVGGLIYYATRDVPANNSGTKKVRADRPNNSTMHTLQPNEEMTLDRGILIHPLRAMTLNNQNLNGRSGM